MKQLQITKKELLKELLTMKLEKTSLIYLTTNDLVERYNAESFVETVGCNEDGKTDRYLIAHTLDGFIALRKIGTFLRHSGEKSIDEEIIVGTKEITLKALDLKKEDEEKLNFILDRLRLQVALYEK